MRAKKKRDEANSADRQPGDGAADATQAQGDANAFGVGRGTEIFDKMLLARRVRMVALAAFTIFVAWQQMWLLTGIGAVLMLLTLWQNKRLREEIAVRIADEEAARRAGS